MGLFEDIRTFKSLKRGLIHFIDLSVGNFALKLLSSRIKYLQNIGWRLRDADQPQFNSPKDKIIFSELRKDFKMTDFEYKLIQNGAHKKDFAPNTLEFNTNGDTHEETKAVSQLFEIFKVAYNMDSNTMDLLNFNTAEIIMWKNYKKKNIQRLLDMEYYFRKRSLRMTIKNFRELGGLSSKNIAQAA